MPVLSWTPPATRELHTSQNQSVGPRIIEQRFPYHTGDDPGPTLGSFTRKESLVQHRQVLLTLHLQSLPLTGQVCSRISMSFDGRPALTYGSDWFKTPLAGDDLDAIMEHVGNLLRSELESCWGLQLRLPLG